MKRSLAYLHWSFALISCVALQGIAQAQPTTRPATRSAVSGAVPSDAATQDTACRSPSSAPLTVPGESETARLLEPLRRARVSYEGPYASGEGFLVHDTRTVLAAHNSIILPHRPLVFTLDKVERSSSSIEELIDSAVGESVLFHLDGEMPGAPLRVSTREVAVGDPVYLIYDTVQKKGGLSLRTGMGIGVSTITSITASSISVGGAPDRLLLVLDPDGAVVGFNTGEGIAPMSVLLASPKSPRTGVLWPKIGFRLGGGEEGNAGKTFILDIELGLSIWDRLSLSVHLGLSFGGEKLVSLIKIDEFDPHHAHVYAAPIRTHVGLEAKYRLLFSRTSAAYLDLVAGAQGAFLRYRANGPAYLSNDPGCDPQLKECPLQVQSADQFLDQLDRDGIGPVFGVDVRMGVLICGYRFLPGKLSYNLADYHMFTTGLSFF